jgi:hypothetical protein
MSKPVGERYTVAVDFDGVIHSYASPWVNAETIPDPPVDGAIAWLNEIADDFEVVISRRAASLPLGAALCGSGWRRTAHAAASLRRSSRPTSRPR